MANASMVANGISAPWHMTSQSGNGAGSMGRSGDRRGVGMAILTAAAAEGSGWASTSRRRRWGAAGWAAVLWAPYRPLGPAPTPACKRTAEQSHLTAKTANYSQNVAKAPAKTAPNYSQNSAKIPAKTAAKHHQITPNTASQCQTHKTVTKLHSK